MATAVKYGTSPFLEQIAFLLGKVNVPTRAWFDVWRDGHDAGFMVAGAYKAQLLADLREAVVKAIAAKRSLAEFRKEFDQVVERYGWNYKGGRSWRTRVIYETNMQTSYQAGRYAQLTSPELLKIAPFWEYEHSDLVQHPRVQHLAWDGLVLRADDPWWQKHYPPNDWGCQCTVRARSEGMLKRKGKAVGTAPAEQLETVTIGTRSGKPQEVSVPAGVGPGWDYAPGATRAEVVRSQVRQKLVVLPKPLHDQLARELRSIPPAPAAPRPKAS